MIKNNISRILSIMFVLIGLVLIGVSIKMKEDKRLLNESNSCKYEELANKELVNYTDSIKKDSSDEYSEEKELIYSIFKDMDKDDSKKNEITFSNDKVTIEFKKYKSTLSLIEFSEKYNKAEYGTNKRVVNEKNRLIYTVNYLNEDVYNEEIIAILSISDNEKVVLTYNFKNTCVPEEVTNSIIESIKLEADETDPIKSANYVTLYNDSISIDMGIDYTKYKNNRDYNIEKDSIYLSCNDDDSELRIYLLSYDTSKYESDKEALNHEIKLVYDNDDVSYDKVTIKGKTFNVASFELEGETITYYSYKIKSNNMVIIKNTSSNSGFQIEDFSDIKTTDK